LYEKKCETLKSKMIMRERQREIESVSEYRNTSGTVYINIKKD
jgi:hypothetical protein